jgi:hypothetical protein
MRVVIIWGLQELETPRQKLRNACTALRARSVQRPHTPPKNEPQIFLRFYVFRSAPSKGSPAAPVATKELENSQDM